MPRIRLSAALAVATLAMTAGCAELPTVSTTPPSETVAMAWPSADARLTPAEMREIQFRLNQLGYATGQPDGMIGEQTRTAISRYQSDLGVQPNGRVSETLLTALRGQTGGDPAAAIAGAAPQPPAEAAPASHPAAAAPPPDPSTPAPIVRRPLSQETLPQPQPSNFNRLDDADLNRRGGGSGSGGSGGGGGGGGGGGWG